MFHVLRPLRWGVFLVLATHLVTPLCSAKVVINEIHYDPDIKTEWVEFVELYNTDVSAVNLSGWSLDGGIAYTFPNGTTIPANGFLVIAQDPAAVLKKFGVSALGPWLGKLRNEGDTVRLLNAASSSEDEVQYQLGFPWPTVGDAPGYSIELINPQFENSLGGNWRASVTGGNQGGFSTLVAEKSEWKYFKGLSEASDPATSWRLLNFDDSAWMTGNTPMGYGGDMVMGVELGDMRYSYTTVFLRQTFEVADLAAISELLLEAQHDDGFKLWINGVSVVDGQYNMASGEVPYYGTSGPAREDLSFVPYTVPSPQNFLVSGMNVIAVQAANSSLANSSDFYFDMRLQARAGAASHGPTPGAVNSVSASNAPPQIRQVQHGPKQPASGQPVLVTAKVSDPEGVKNVALEYQLVEPGAYISLTDAAFESNWTAVAMNDSGADGDAMVGDSIFTALLPPTVQQHRRLVRYRVTATDSTGAQVRVPYPDDPQPNFAYFVYDGVPAWQAAVRPGATPVLSFDTNTMQHLPVVQLISKNSDVEEGTWWSRYGGDAYPWSGTVVYDGEVYDHVHYRARGGVWRYAMVKNMWKFDFNTGHSFQMRDDYGRKYDTTWTKLNLGASIQQKDFWHRGEQGMFESVGFRLFNLAGVESPNTTFVQLRIIDDALETDPGSQYEGDFWGLYLAVEQEDGRFLDEHGLPDGNFYKMENGTGELNNLGPLGPMDKSDLNSFLNTYRQSANSPSYYWWNTNLDLANYYSYQAIVQGIHHYDICYGKNYFYFRNPASGLWSVHSWDLDLTWANNMYDAGCGGVDDLYYPVFGGNAYPVKGQITLGYKNRVREIRELLFNPDQAWQLIDEQVRLLRGSQSGPTILDADRCQWDYNPKMGDPAYSSSPGKAGQGEYYRWSTQPAGITKDFNGCIQLMKNYVASRGNVLDNLALDGGIPALPTVTYTGPSNYPLTQLTFQSSPYSGTYAFAAMKWRVGEVTDSNAPAFNPTDPVHYEIEPLWDSGELTSFVSEITLPSAPLKVGHAYRVRVQMKDYTGRCSRWSAPIQFVAGLPGNAAILAASLRLTELMYQPLAGNDYEYLELHNTNKMVALDLSGAAFTAGIDFVFPANSTLAPGAYGLVIKTADPAAFRTHYQLSDDVPLFGPYSGSLNNDGEHLALKTGAGGLEVFDLDYGQGRGWPVAAQGAGHSLVPKSAALEGQATGALDYPGNWVPSGFIAGSPGRAELPVPPAPVLLNEITAHTDYYDPARPEYDSNDWIELFNPASTPFTFGPGWYLSDEPLLPTKWAIPAVSVPAGGWVVFDEVTGFHTPITSGFGLDKAGEAVLLSYLPGTASDRVVDAMQFKGQPNGVSLGRYPDGAPNWYSMLRSQRTANTAGLPGLVISEIMYHPPDLGTNDNTRDEFIEILNPTSSPVFLQDTNGTWRLGGGVAFTFPANTSIPANGILLVVNFDPADTDALGTFRQVYGITNTGISILGPYAGKLGNRSDRVAIERPQFPDLPADPYSWIILDEVIYGNQSPFATSPNGGGTSLQRISTTQIGNEPANWSAGIPDPGIFGTATADRDGDGMPDSWEIQHNLDPGNPADASLDSDSDGITNLAEYTSGTDPRDPLSVLELQALPSGPSGLSLSFTAISGKSYSVQYRFDASAGAWQNLTNVLDQPVTTTIEILIPDTEQFNSRYYRLVTPALP